MYEFPILDILFLVLFTQEVSCLSTTSLIRDWHGWIFKYMEFFIKFPTMESRNIYHKWFSKHNEFWKCFRFFFGYTIYRYFYLEWKQRKSIIFHLFGILKGSHSITFRSKNRKHPRSSSSVCLFILKIKKRHWNGRSDTPKHVYNHRSFDLWRPQTQTHTL